MTSRSLRYIQLLLCLIFANVVQEKGDAEFCFVSQMLEDSSFGLNDEETAYLAGNLSQAPDTAS